MKKLIGLMTLIGFIFMFTGCGEKVPPAHYGKKLTPSGYLPEVLEPGRYFIWIREDLILLDGATHMVTLPLKVTMKDTNVDGSSRLGLDMDFEVSLRYKLKSDPNILNVVFNDIKVEGDYLSSDIVFNTYANVLIQNKVREILSTYTPEEALSNREAISNRVNIEMKETLKTKPIEVTDIVVSKMTLPDVIQKRIAANKERELRLAEAQAQQRIDVEKRDNEIILAQKEAEKRLIDAKAASEQNKILDQGLTDKVLELRRLEIQQAYAEAWKVCMESEGECGKNTIYMPYEAMTGVGANMRMFQK